MTKQEILDKVEYLVDKEIKNGGKNLYNLLYRLYDLDFAYKRLIKIERLINNE